MPDHDPAADPMDTHLSAHLDTTRAALGDAAYPGDLAADLGLVALDDAPAGAAPANDALSGPAVWWWRIGAGLLAAAACVVIVAWPKPTPTAPSPSDGTPVVRATPEPITGTTPGTGTPPDPSPVSYAPASRIAPPSTALPSMRFGGVVDAGNQGSRLPTGLPSIGEARVPLSLAAAAAAPLRHAAQPF